MIPIWGALHLLAYSSLGVPAYHWYALPVVLSIIFCLGGTLQWSLDGSKLARRTLSPLVGLVALLGIGWNLYHYSIFDPLEPRVAAYRTVAEWIVNETPEHWTLAAAEIGTLGYHSRRTMVDMGGLLHQQGEQLGAGELGWWMQKRPNLVLLHTPAWPLEAAAETGSTGRSYRLLKQFRFDEYQTLRLFERKDTTRKQAGLGVPFTPGRDCLRIGRHAR